MCGIIGIVGGNAKKREDAVLRALPTLSLRGPDSDGRLFFAGAALGHTRLAIIDLATGAQPMKDSKHNIAISFNGEIFNYRELRRNLEMLGHLFSTASDTEVVVKAYIEYGDRCPEYFDGQFAFAIWDEDRKRLFMARDRFGEKPLFYSERDGMFLFASEIKALLATGIVGKELDRTSLDNYLALYFVPPWRTIYRDITPLPPAHRAVFENGRLSTEQYWSISQAPITMPFEDAAREVRRLLSDSAKSRMVADVEVGVFLSGGIDSSVVAALSQTHAETPLKSFSAGFDAQVNELPYARETAEHIGTDHHERMVEVSLEAMRTAMRYLDEPLGDSSIVPTSLIAALAREYVPVALSGDGGDELFFGYNHYRAHWHLPAYKKALALILGYTPDTLYRRSHLNMFAVHERVRLWRDASAVERDPTAHLDLSAAVSPLQRIALLDMRLKLPGDMLVKVDRASMMHSLEVRSPFLNHELAQFAFNLPDAYKTSRTRGKVILEKACSDLVPQGVFTRKKQGFGAPLKYWLTEEPVRGLIDEMRSDSRISAYVNVDIVRSYIDDFYNGRRELSYKLWMLLALELWMREHEGKYS